MTLSGRISSNTLILFPLLVSGLFYWYITHTTPLPSEDAQLADPGRYGFPSWYFEVKDETPGGQESIQGRPFGRKTPMSLLVVFDSQTAPSSHLTTIDHLLHSPPSNLVPTLYDTSWPNSHLRMQGGSGKCAYEAVWLLGDVDLGEIALPQACNDVPQIRQPDFHLASAKKQFIPLKPDGITILDEVPHSLLEEILTEAYREEGDSWKIGKSKGGAVKKLGLYAHFAPIADSSIFHPRKSLWPAALSRRKVTLFRSQGSKAPKLPKRWSWSKFTIKPVSRSGRSSLLPFLSAKPADLQTILKRHETQQRRLAKKFGQSDVCVFEDSWSSGLLTEEVVQAIMAGCTVAGVLPSLHRQALEDIYLSLPSPSSPILPLGDGKSKPPSSTSPKFMSYHLSRRLATTTRFDLAKKSLLGVVFARGELNMGRRWRWVERLVDGYETGKRGFEFPSGYAVDCDIAGGATGWRAAWCGGVVEPKPKGVWEKLTGGWSR